MDSKAHIKEIWFPGNGESHDSCIRLGSNGVLSIGMEKMSCGAHDEDWILVQRNPETSLINPKQVTEIVWTTEEKELPYD